MADLQGGQVVWNLDVVDKGFASGLARAEAQTAAFGGSLKSVNFSQFASQASTAFGGVASSIAGLAKVATGLFIGGAFGAGIFIKQASELQSLKASFESMTGSAEAANKVLKQLNKFSFETAFSTLDINKAAQLLLGAGVRVEDLGARMKQIGDIAGATGANLGALTLPLSQALARGKLQTQDFYQILNSGAGTFRKVLEEEVVKRGLGNLQDALAAGTIDSDVLTAALENANKQGGFAFEGAIKQSKTFAGQVSNLKETIGNVALNILGIDKATGTVKAGGIFDNLTKSVQGLMEWLNKNQKALIGIANTIVHNIIPVLGGLAAAFLAAKLAAIGFGIAAALSNPFTAIAFAITLLVGLLTTLQLKFDIFGKAFAAIKPIVDPIVAIFQTLFHLLAEQLAPVFELINKHLEVFKVIGIALAVVVLAPLVLAIAAVVAGVIGAIAIFTAIIFLFRKLIEAISAVIHWFADLYSSIIVGAINAVGSVVSWFAGLPDRIRGAVGNLGSILYNTGRDVIQGFINGVKDMFNNVKDTLGNLTKKLTSWKGPASLDRKILQSSGQMIIGGFITGLESQYSGVRASLNSLTQDLGLNGNLTLGQPVLAAQAQVGGSTSGTTQPAQIVQNNNIYNQVDLDQVTRDLAWRLQQR